jgi:hypothetical protein
MKKCVSILITFLLVFLLLVSNRINCAAQTQTTETAAPLPWTADQCVEKARTWLNSFDKNQKNLSQSEMAARVQAMSKCENRRDISKKKQWYVLEAQSCYMSAMLIRHLHYLQRHDQQQQFVSDDEAGER